MTYKTYSAKLDYLKQLVKQEITGTPFELATTLNVSEKTVRRMIGYLIDEGINIRYSRKIKTYYYSSPL